MKRDIERLKNINFDLLVIGGGINGCAIARDAALRGAKAALIEKNDFASGASGKTTKLIHGGLRYLEQFNLNLVYEALHERAILLKTLPHLVKPLLFIFPVYNDDPRHLFLIKAGVALYWLLAGRDSIGPHRHLNKNSLVAIEQNIQSRNLKGGVVYYDAVMDDIRICLDNAISAYKAGCAIANKTEALSFIKEKNKITGVIAKDNLTCEKFEIQAKIVVSAAGAWANRIVKMDDTSNMPITRPTKGAHIVYKRLPHQQAIIASTHKDKRIFFIIPWRGYSLIGTTDTDYSGSPDEVYATGEDIEYLLGETRRIFPSELIDKQGIITTFAALRPLANISGKPAWQVSREHLIHESKSGLISVVGGKYTTYRALAEQVVNLILAKLKKGVFQKCITHKFGPSTAIPADNEAGPEKVIERAVKEEMTNSLSDLLLRRLQVLPAPSYGPERINDYAEIMAGILGWSDLRKESEINKYRDEIKMRF